MQTIFEILIFFKFINKHKTILNNVRITLSMYDTIHQKNKYLKDFLIYLKYI